jgi:Flp pilus assembly protein TadD
MDRILRDLPGGLWTGAIALALTIRLAGGMWADELVFLPGPELTGSAQILSRLPATDNPAGESLVEMPIAEMARPAPESQVVTALPKVGNPLASPLPTAETLKERSQQLEQVAQQADRRTRYGFELAGRGAYFAARSEFIGAMRLVAEGLDTEHKSNVHGRALAAALGAMKEAEDFLPGGSRLEANLDLPGLVATHTTPVLKDNTENVTSLMALRCYFTFAQEQFAVAAGREVAGSMALHALGKLHAALAQKKGSPAVAPESKAMVFYQAALLVYPTNYMAANDLGVLLAQCGHYANARTMLERSAALCPLSTNCGNLAVVYRQLGQAALAEQTAGQAMLLRQNELARRQVSPTASNDAVRWVDQQAFAQNSTSTMNPPGAIPLSPAAKPQVAGGRVGVPQAAGRRVAAPQAPGAAESYGPAPTPAAAERMSWGTRAYQR